ncbi:MAG: excinuclease ABC subunit C, partial [Flavobacteriaceae bacterium]
SAVKSLDRLGLRGQIAIIGIAKRLEEIYYPGDSIPMYLDKKSETLKVIQQLRNEAHRFGLTLHRNIRSKNALKSPLDGVEGIGSKTKELLLKEFKSLKRIKAASEQEIINMLGKIKGVKIYKKLKEL